MTLLSLNSCFTVEESFAFAEVPYNKQQLTERIQSKNLSETKKQQYINLLGKILENKEIKDTINQVKFQRLFTRINDSIRLEYFSIEPDVVKNTGIFFFGNGGNVLNYLDLLTDLSKKTESRIYIPNYRKYGFSNGFKSFETQFADNQTFFDFIKNKDKPNFIIGFSIGAVFGNYLGVDNNIENLILIAPASNTSETLQFLKKKYTKGFKKLARPFVTLKTDNALMNISNIDKIEKFKNKLLVFHGIEDDELPFKMGEGVFNHCPSKTKVLVPLKGGHGALFMEENRKIVTDEINKLLLTSVSQKRG